MSFSCLFAEFSCSSQLSHSGCPLCHRVSKLPLVNSSGYLAILFGGHFIYWSLLHFTRLVRLQVFPSPPRSRSCKKLFTCQRERPMFDVTSRPLFADIVIRHSDKGSVLSSFFFILSSFFLSSLFFLFSFFLSSFCPFFFSSLLFLLFFFFFFFVFFFFSFFLFLHFTFFFFYFSIFFCENLFLLF